ncbi:HCO3 transporter family-domain-containing protein [Chytridium lagenaria]|nr:HCO3 transporter family-domain-containing protein [Chytridium lagenaria]
MSLSSGLSSIVPPHPPPPSQPSLMSRFAKDVRQELSSRLRIYLSDYTDHWNDKRVWAASVFMFFATIAPAITFAAFLSDKTNAMIGVTEVLLSTAMNGVLFSVFAGQPLVIVGVTGPISIFTVTVYVLCERLGVPFLPFLSCTHLWAAGMHVMLAVTGSCRLVRHVTRFTGEIFETGLLSLLFGLATFAGALYLSTARRWSVFIKVIRGLIADYAIPLSVIAATVISSTIPRLRETALERLKVPSASPFLTPTTTTRSWFINLSLLSTSSIFLAAVPGAILTVLIFFDHNVSALLSQRPEHNLKKPLTYNYDFFIVGLTMIPTALLGLPVAHGLIPQAPLHVRALAKIRRVPSIHNPSVTVEVWDRVAEQRWSNLAQSAMVFIVLIPPVLGLLGQIPRAVLAGLFLYMGTVFRDSKVSMSACVKLTIVQIVFLAGTLAVTESDGPVALTFPIFIIAKELELLDADEDRDGVVEDKEVVAEAVTAAAVEVEGEGLVVGRRIWGL